MRCAQRVHEHALAAADVEQRARGGAREQLVERALEAGHQPPHDGVARAVLVVGVAGDDPLVGDRDAAAHSANRLALLLRRARFVVRRRDAELQLDPPHALERALRHHALRGEQVADHAERPHHAAAMNSTAPRISDCTWPLPLPSA